MRTYDLIVVGAGSGNSILGPEVSHLKTAIVEPDRFGGTCLNRGCIPSKMLVVAADAARGVTEAARLGVHASVDRVDWPGIRDRVFGRVDPLHQSAVAYRCENGVDVYTEPARFVAPRVLDVAGEQLTAEQIVVAAGSRPVVPPIPGLDGVPFHTSDTIMRIDQIPSSLIVLGGGFIAAEMGHVFEAFGAKVTMVQRGPRLLMAEDEDISSRFTELAADRFRLLLGCEATSVRMNGETVEVTVEGAAGTPARRGEVVEGDCLLVAVGRRPNTDLLDVAAAGLEVDAHGHLVADETYRTSVPGVWSFGDIANHFQLKHMANAEERVVAHNLTHGDDLRRLGSHIVPHAVFSDPQVAGFGITEQEAVRRGLEHVVARRNYADTAYGWALEDTTSFIKVIADPTRRTLLGAHLIGPQAATLIQPLLQAVMLGQTVDQVAHDVLYIHPALTEVVEQVLLEL